MKNQIAKGIRVITVPPVLVSAMLLILHRVYGKAFASVPMLVCAIFFLALIPVLAYPLASFQHKQRGSAEMFPTLRDTQRHLAFLLTIVGYLVGFTVGLLGHCTTMMMGIFTGYFVGVVFLAVLNRCFHIKASGHACSCMIAYLFLWYWLGFGVLFICIPLYIGEFWASVFLKRHTAKEFMWGTGTAVLAFLVQWLLYFL